MFYDLHNDFLAPTRAEAAQDAAEYAAFRAAAAPLPPVDLPVSREDFLPAGLPPMDPEDLPF